MKTFNRNNKLLIPSALALGAVPLVMHAFYYNCGLSEFDWFPNDSDQMSDYFLAWKMIAIICVGIVMVSVLLFQHFSKREKVRFEDSFYVLLLYGLFVGMSALFSRYKHWVLTGTHAMFESVWVVFSYLLFCYYTYRYVQNEEDVRSLLKLGGMGVLILTLIGALQFAGLDFYKSTVGRMLISYPGHWNNLDQIEFKVPSHTVYASLYNQNYFSFYCGILLPVLIALLLGSKKKGERLVLATVTILTMMCLLGSQSSSGWMALCLAAVIVALILLSRKKKWLVGGCISMCVLLAAGTAVCIVTPIGTKLSALLAGTSTGFSLRSIDTTDGCIRMDINGNILRVTYDLDETTNQVSVSCTDETGTELEQTYPADDPTAAVISNPAYLDCQVTPVMYQDMLSVDITLEDHHWYFTKQEDGSYCIINQAGKLESYRSPEFSSLFKDDAFSLRGHIWDGVIPILGKYALVGSGANTFIFAYPQNDYIYREYMDLQNVLDVKAHSLYLQQWVENGLPALLAFLGFFLWYAVRSIRICRKSDLKDPMVLTGIGIFNGLLTYMIVALANDSNVCTAPVFWVMLGLGMAVNRIITEKQQRSVVPEVLGMAEDKTPEVAQITGGSMVGPSSSGRTSGKKNRKKKHK